MTKTSNVTIGIDLGTTYCCVASYVNGKAQVIINSQGSETTPSYVTIVEDEDVDSDDETDQYNNCFIGLPSKDAAIEHPQETLYDVKRLIGRKFTDPCVQRSMKFWPFEVVKDPNSLSPQIKIKDRLYNPEEISGRILLHLKRRAEEVLGCDTTDVVITVPAYFNDGQRQATKDAGKIAGLNVLQIINEPTAAALAYDLHRKNPESKINCLVFDLGGGTFDVSILTLENKTVKVLAVGGDTQLGGEDFDNKMVDHCLQEFKKEHNIDIHDIRKNLSNMKDAQAQKITRAKINKSLRRIKNECERQKVYLSATNSVAVIQDYFYDGKLLKVPFKRTLFESLNNKYFEKCMRIVEDVLKESKLTKQGIDEIVLVGGSSRIPKIQQMLSEFFDGKILLNSIDKDSAIACGAAIQASALGAVEQISESNVPTEFPMSSGLNSFPHNRLPSVISDVVPISIGVELDKVMGGDDGNFDVIIPKNSSIPNSWNKEFATTADNVRTIRVNIFEGESRFTRENHHLGNFILTDLPRCPQGEPIQITMEVDKEGILDVSAKLPRQKIQNKISITEHKGRLTKEQIEQMALR